MRDSVYFCWTSQTSRIASSSKNKCARRQTYKNYRCLFSWTLEGNTISHFQQHSRQGSVKMQDFWQTFWCHSEWAQCWSLIFVGYMMKQLVFQMHVSVPNVSFIQASQVKRVPSGQKGLPSQPSFWQLPSFEELVHSTQGLWKSHCHWCSKVASKERTKFSD